MLQVGLKIFFFPVWCFSLSEAFPSSSEEGDLKSGPHMSPRFAAVGRALCLPLRDRGSSPCAPSWVSLVQPPPGYRCPADPSGAVLAGGSPLWVSSVTAGLVPLTCWASRLLSHRPSRCTISATSPACFQLLALIPEPEALLWPLFPTSTLINSP